MEVVPEGAQGKVTEDAGTGLRFSKAELLRLFKRSEALPFRRLVHGGCLRARKTSRRHGRDG